MMNKPIALSAFLVALNTPLAAAQMNNDPLLGSILVDQFEVRDRGHSNLNWELEGWVGRDLDKLWIKAEGERNDGRTEDNELQVLYSHAVAPYWDLQVGVRQDFEPSPERSWAVIGLQGLAPYFFEIDTALFIGESGHTALRLKAEYELLLTQRWVLVPELETNVYGRNDEESGFGSGLSDLELGLRLRYEVTRKFSPYVGVVWERKYGNTADFARQDGESVEEAEFVLGLRAWF